MPALIPIEQLERLRRENWQGEDGATRLSQEMYALLGADLPIDVSSNVTIHQQDPSLPALQIIPSTDPNAVPAVVFPGGGGGGGLSPTTIVFPSTPPADALPVALPVVLYGVVQSGSGHTYVVRCWMGDPAAFSPIGDLSCFQSQIDATETIPAGTVCFVWVPINAGVIAGTPRLTIPVFLA